jgi:ATP-dependent Clp protease ATP-binding subunit ClpC
VDFKNTVIIMTSNIGAKAISQKTAFGFAAADQTADQKKIKEEVMAQLKTAFRPEFINRIDDIIVFKQLNEQDIKEIAVRMLNTLTKRVKDNMEITLTFEESAIQRLAELGFDKVYGARPLRRAIQSYIEDPLSEEILEGALQKGDTALCKVENQQFLFQKQ